jgi:hypothetical protein
VPVHSITTSANALKKISAAKTDQFGEDKQAEFETLRNVKTFLTEKLKQNEVVVKLM